MQQHKEEAIKALGITEEMYDELVGDFVEQVSLTIDELKNAIDRGETEKIRKTAHSIKGSAGNLRLNDIFEIAKKIEHNNDKSDIIKGEFLSLIECLEKIKGANIQ